MSYYMTNTEFLIALPNGDTLVVAQRLVDPANRCAEPDETEWKIDPRFHRHLTPLEYLHDPIVVRGEDNARQTANEWAAIVDEHNLAIQAAQQKHVDRLKETS